MSVRASREFYMYRGDMKKYNFKSKFQRSKNARFVPLTTAIAAAAVPKPDLMRTAASTRGRELTSNGLEDVTGLAMPEG